MKCFFVLALLVSLSVTIVKVKFCLSHLVFLLSELPEHQWNVIMECYIFTDIGFCLIRCNNYGGEVKKLVSLAGWGVEGTPQTMPQHWQKLHCPTLLLISIPDPWAVATIMVTLITEQLRKQCLEEAQNKTFSFTVNAVSSTQLCSWLS